MASVASAGGVGALYRVRPNHMRRKTLLPWLSVCIAVSLFFLSLALGSNSEGAAARPEVVTETTVTTVTVGRAQLAALSEQRVKLAARDEKLDLRALRLSAREASLDARALCLLEREQALERAAPPPAPLEPAPQTGSSACDASYTGCVPGKPICRAK